MKKNTYHEKMSYTLEELLSIIPDAVRKGYDIEIRPSSAMEDRYFIFFVSRRQLRRGVNFAPVTINPENARLHQGRAWKGENNEN